MTTEEAGDDPVTANRRRQLRRWIDSIFGGNQAAFGASTADGESQINQGELSGLLRKKSFGEKRARRLERQAGMPPRYLESASEPDEANMVEFAPTPHAAGPAPAVHAIWPFKLASFKRLSEMRAALGPVRGPEAMSDIDKHLDIVITKWEREAQTGKKRAGHR